MERAFSHQFKSIHTVTLRELLALAFSLSLRGLSAQGEGQHEGAQRAAQSEPGTVGCEVV